MSCTAVPKAAFHLQGPADMDQSHQAECSAVVEGTYRPWNTTNDIVHVSKVAVSQDAWPVEQMGTFKTRATALVLRDTNVYS